MVSEVASGSSPTARPPLIEGQASMGWDDQGQLLAEVDSSRKGGGAIAQAQAEQLGVGLEQGLQTQQQQQGIPPEQQVVLNPEHMPVVGYHSQYETIRSLSWTDESGQTHTRYYDANGNHPSGSTMAQDYVQMVLQGGALAPAWLIAGAQDQYSQISQQAAQLEAQIATLQQQAQALGPQTMRYGAGEGGWEETLAPADSAAYAQVLQDIEQLQAQAGALRDDGRIDSQDIELLVANDDRWAQAA